MPNVYERIYEKLGKLGVLDVRDHKVLKSGGFMDLHIERLGKYHYSLTHYFEQNGDLVPDPDMEVRTYPETRMAEALSYQDQFGYRVVYPEEGKVNVAAKRDLNEFLDFWLSNLIRQGFAKKARGAAMRVGPARAKAIVVGKRKPTGRKRAAGKRKPEKKR